MNRIFDNLSAAANPPKFTGPRILGVNAKTLADVLALVASAATLLSTALSGRNVLTDESGQITFGPALKVLKCALALMPMVPFALNHMGTLAKFCEILAIILNCSNALRDDNSVNYITDMLNGCGNDLMDVDLSCLKKFSIAVAVWVIRGFCIPALGRLSAA